MNLRMKLIRTPFVILGLCLLNLPSSSAMADTVQWDFRGDLNSSNGAAVLVPRAASPAKVPVVRFGKERVAGAQADVARFDRGTYFALRHGFPPNATGFVDTYTLVMDVRLDTPARKRRNWRALLQTQQTNNGDADWGINRKRRLGVSRNFGGTVVDGQWHRLALVVDGKAGTASSFINGARVSRRTRIREGERWLLESEALLFADNDRENIGGWVSSVQISDVALSDDAVAALGGPKAAGIARTTASPPSWGEAPITTTAGGVVSLRWNTGAAPQGHVDILVKSSDASNPTAGAGSQGIVASVPQGSSAFDWRVSPFMPAGAYSVQLGWGAGRKTLSSKRMLTVQAIAGLGRAPQSLGKDLVVGGTFGDALGAHWKKVEGGAGVSTEGGRLGSTEAGDFRLRQVIDLTAHGLAKPMAHGLALSASVRLGSALPAWRFDDQAWLEVTALSADGAVLRQFVSLHDAGPDGISRILEGRLPAKTSRLQVDAVSRHLRGRSNSGWVDDVRVAVRPWANTFEPRVLRITKGPMLQDSRGDVMTVLWETNLNPQMPRVSLGPAGAASALVDRFDGIETRRIDEWRFLHVARFRKLSANTAYSYRVGADGVMSKTFTFRTAPAPEQNFSIGWMADNQYGWRTFRKLLPKLARRKPDLAIFPGDIVQNGYDLREWHTQWFKSLAVGDFVAKTPLLFARGNHDGEWPYAYGYSALPGFESYYSFTYGNTFIIVLDTESGRYGSGRQTRWLKQQLKSQAYKDAAFRIVTMHKPPYTNLWDGRHEYDGEKFVRDKWVPLFERHRLDLCVAGHAHAYERGRQRGVTYVIVGGAGGRLDDDRSGEWPFLRKLVPKHHYNVMSVSGGRLEWRSYDSADRPIDRFVVRSRNPKWRNVKGIKR